MKRIAKLLLLLTAFSGFHAILRIVFEKALNRYVMSLPHCKCGDDPIWLIWLSKASDFFFFWPYPILSDIMWGCVALAIYLWVEVRRNANRKSRLIAGVA